MTTKDQKESKQNESHQETQKEKPIKPKKSKPWLKWLLLIVVVIVGFVSFNFYRANQMREERFTAMQEQRQTMIDYWTEQGLSKEEIEQKLQDQRPEDYDNFQPTLFHSIFRSFRQVTGSKGPGGGQGMGGGMRPSQ